MNTPHRICRSQLHRMGVLVGLAILLVLQQPVRAQSVLHNSVFSIGGGVTANGTYHLVASLGQPLVGQSANGTHGLHLGFWQAAVSIVRVDVEEDGLEGEVPRQYHLHQNYPNPFNPETTLSYEVRAPAHVVLKVFNLLGQEVATLVDAQRAPGRHEVRFEARSLPSGTYFYRVEMGDFRDVKMMILLK